MLELPQDLPVVERTAVRVVLLDTDGAVLLFRTRDPDIPELGLWWELPGGGLDQGETFGAAAVRELREETGIVVEPAQVGPPGWRWRAAYRHSGVRRLQQEVAVVVRLDEAAPDLDESGRLPDELRCYVGHRWWPVHELPASRERFYPRRLPELLPAFVSGQLLDEPFEFWS